MPDYVYVWLFVPEGDFHFVVGAQRKKNARE